MANSRLARSTRPYTRLSTHRLVSLRLSNRRHGLPFYLDSHPFTLGASLLAAAGRLSPHLHALAADVAAHRTLWGCVAPPLQCGSHCTILPAHTRLSACCQCVKLPLAALLPTLIALRMSEARIAHSVSSSVTFYEYTADVFYL